MFLTPSFKLEEPNVISTLRKNKEGICAMHKCEQPVYKNYRLCKEHLAWYGAKNEDSILPNN